MKWKAYWIALLAGLAGLIYFKNARKYKDENGQFKVVKSVLEFLGIVMAAIYLPPLLVAYASLWLTKRIKHEYIRLTIGLSLGVGLMLLASFFLEGLIIMGVFAIELVSADLLSFYAERKKAYELKQGIAAVLDSGRSKDGWL